MPAMRLKRSTAVTVSFGPFLDKTDGVTLETGLVSALDHSSTGIMLSKNGGALAVRHATVTASTYDAHGCYLVVLDTTDTATLGKLRMIFTEPATCLPVWMDFDVVAAGVYDDIALTELASIDGLTPTAFFTALLAVEAGVAAPSGNAVAFKKRDGTTTICTITYGSTDGERTGSTIA